MTPTEQTTLAAPAPTQLLLISGRYGYDTDKVFQRVLQALRIVRGQCGYTFPMPVPTGLIEVPATVTETHTRLFSKETYEVKVPWLNYYLVFDRELTEAELTLWRAFKIGYYARRGFTE